jgi:hypothetical protein
MKSSILVWARTQHPWLLSPQCAAANYPPRQYRYPYHNVPTKHANFIYTFEVEEFSAATDMPEI